MAVSCYIAEQLSLQDVLSFLIFLARLKCLIVLPAYGLIALSARNIPHDVPACRHVPLAGIARCDVDNVVEEVRFAMLAPEILIHYVSNESSFLYLVEGRGFASVLAYSADDVFMVREVRLAVLAAIDFVAIEIDIV
jgi:hypothetical protein